MFRIPDHVRLITEDLSELCEKKGNDFIYNDISVTFKENNSLNVFLCAKETRPCYIVLRYNREWSTGSRFYGDAFERASGQLEWRGITPETIYSWYFTAVCNKSLEGYGVKTNPNSFVFYTVDSEGFNVWIDVRCGAKGVCLNGRELLIGEFVYYKEDGSFEDAFDFMHKFCVKLCDHPIFPAHPVYGSNNWYYAYGNSSEKQILEDTKILARQTEGLKNRPYMVIDDCWQPLARTIGSAMGRPIDRGNELFPDMKGLADKIKAMNIHPGLWFRPLKTNEKFFDKSLLNERESQFMDPSCPEILKLVAEDTERITKTWGYELIKFDFATRDALGEYYPNPDNLFQMKGWSFKDTTRTSAEIIKEFYKTIYEHSNNAVIIGCNVIGHLAAGYIHIHRSGDDTSGVSYDRSIRYGINTLAFRYHQHKAFFHIDADCVCVTKLNPWDKYQDFVDVYARSSSPFFASIAPDAITDDVEAKMKEAYALASKQECSFKPLDWFDTVYPEQYLLNGEKVKYTWMRNFGKKWIHSR